jgi:HK97 family phage prohead protease
MATNPTLETPLPIPSDGLPTAIRAASPTDGPARASLTATAPIEIQAAKGEGKRPTFDIVGYTGAVMLLDGFFNPVIIDLAGFKAGGQEIPALYLHELDRIVGQTDSVSIDAKGVRLTGTITGDNADATEVLNQAKNGFKWRASVGASLHRREFLDAGKKATVNGREVMGPLVIAREAELLEISFVSIGADNQTSVNVAASVPLGSGSSKGADTMKFEEWLQAKEIDPADKAVTDPIRAALKAQYDAEQTKDKPDPRATQTLEQIVAARRAEDQRVAEITRIAEVWINNNPLQVDQIDKIASASIQAKGTDPDKFELTLMRETRAPASNARPAGGVDARTGPKTIEAALCLSGKLEEPDKHFDEKTLNAARTQFRHGLGLQELLLMAARENGYTGHSARDVEGLLKAAFSASIRASGFSTLSLPGTLGNVANKFLAAGFNAVESGWREIAGIRPVNDFKSISSYALTGGMIYEKVGPDGELKHATVGELSYVNKVDTYGRMFSITRQNIINDDLGALTQVPRKLGRGAALALNNVFWTAFLNNSTFFAAGNNNVQTGAGSALASAGLKASLAAFRKQTDPDGLPLAITPKILLVPPELEITADELMTSTMINTGGSSTTAQVPNRNVWAGKFRVVQSSYLSNSAYTGNSATAWYMLADPADLPVIEVAFLNGKETPTVESAEADFNVLGIQFRGYLDFGVGLQEFRAGIRNAGT